MRERERGNEERERERERDDITQRGRMSKGSGLMEFSLTYFPRAGNIKRDRLCVLNQLDFTINTRGLLDDEEW